MSSDHPSCSGDSCDCACCGCVHEITEEPYRKKIIITLFAGIFVLIAVLCEYQVISSPLAGIGAALACLALTAYPIIKEAVLGLIRREWNVCELAALALVAAIVMGEFTAAAEIAFILTIGEQVEEYLYARTGRDIAAMVSKSPRMGYVVREGQTLEVPAYEILPGDRVMVRPGDVIPVDGVVIEGESDVDESFLTGESLPVQKKPGSTVYSGSIDLDGVMFLHSTRASADSSYARIVQMVQEAGKRRPPSHPLVDRFAKIYTPVILLVAGGVTAATGDIARGITVLIVACPCALLLATPSAVLASIGPAAKKGILIKSGKYLEMSTSVTSVFFDKTGTLTTGMMQVTGVMPAGGGTSDDLLRIAGSAEYSSPHPIAKAIVHAAGKAGIAVSCSGISRHIGGKGVYYTRKDETVCAGTREFLGENGIPVPEPDNEGEIDTVQTRVFVARNGMYRGYILVADRVRPEAKGVIVSLKEMGIEKIGILTGDKERVADHIADECGISPDQVHAGLLPQEKGDLIAGLQGDGDVVCFVGDGTNDSPALVRSDLGIGMGSREDTLALDSSSVILMQNGLCGLSSFFSLGKRTSRTISMNIALAAGLNLLLIIVASGGALSPVSGAVGHQVATMAVLLNSLRLAGYDPDNKQGGEWRVPVAKNPVHN